MLQLSIESASKICGVRFILTSIAIALCIDGLSLLSGFGVKRAISEGFEINGKFYLLICGGVLMAGSIKAIIIPSIRNLLGVFEFMFPRIFSGFYNIDLEPERKKYYIRKYKAITAASKHDSSVKYSLIQKRESEIYVRRDLEELCLTVSLCALFNIMKSGSITRLAFSYLNTESEFWWSNLWLFPMTLVMLMSVIYGVNAIRVWEADNYIEATGFEDELPSRIRGDFSTQAPSVQDGPTHASDAVTSSLNQIHK